ncbi:hypothetical protein tb265_45640 [Gemmatimonadetes bacterium T265]|nr:hypothetical protein tb265_45640 [Gemmatimonadetes bacterium T265]
MVPGGHRDEPAPVPDAAPAARGPPSHVLAEAADAGTASRHVGYESPSQFSREYRRLFGAPPLRDVARLRATARIMERSATGFVA